MTCAPARALALALCAGAAGMLGGCMGESRSGTTAAQAPPAPMPGSDRDAHGCIGSAGYAWCERMQQCVRPWELASAQGLEDGAEAFDAFCDVKPPH